MKTIILKEEQFSRLFEDISSLKGSDQTDVIDYPGGSQGASMITTPVTNANGDSEFGDAMNIGSDKIANTMAPQTPFNSRKCGLATR